MGTRKKPGSRSDPRRVRQALRAKQSATKHYAKALPPIDGPVILRGYRHNFMIGVAMRMGKLGYSIDCVIDELHTVNGRFSLPPLDHQDIESIATWTLRDPYCDLGNAQFFAYRYGRDMLWVPNEKRQALWDGGRWKSSKEVGLLSHWAIRDLIVDADTLPEESATKAKKWLLQSQMGGHIEKMVTLTKALVPAEPDDFDANPRVVNVENGVVDLTSGLAAGAATFRSS